jgi:protein-disulfide isomerase
MLIPSLNRNLDHVFGCRFAPLQLVEYGSFQCRACIAAYGEVRLLQEVMGSQLLYAYRHCPDPFLHQLSLDAAVATEVAGVQCKFWEMHDALFENQQHLSRSTLIEIGQDIGVDMSSFTDPGVYKKIAQIVVFDFCSGVKSGVRKTPAFFINGIQYNGRADFNGLLKACRYVQLIRETELKQSTQN